jgi:hypothetical protein
MLISIFTRICASIQTAWAHAWSSRRELKSHSQNNTTKKLMIPCYVTPSGVSSATSQENPNAYCGYAQKWTRDLYIVWYSVLVLFLRWIYSCLILVSTTLFLHDESSKRFCVCATRRKEYWYQRSDGVAPRSCFSVALGMPPEHLFCSLPYSCGHAGRIHFGILRLSKKMKGWLLSLHTLQNISRIIVGRFMQQTPTASADSPAVCGYQSTQQGNHQAFFLVEIS